MTEFKQVTDVESENDAEHGFERQLPPPLVGRVDNTQLGLLLAVLRDAVPPEVQRHFASFMREGLLTVRAVIDWYIERLDSPSDSRSVEDIPIE